MDYTMRFGMGTGATTYFALGFCPAKIRITGTTEEDVNEWFVNMPVNDSIGVTDSDGIRALDTSHGITLVSFSDPNDPENATITDLEPAEWYKANGVKIGSGAASIANTVPYVLEAWGMPFPIVRGVHDGGATKHTYFQDSSVDFEEAGVSGGQSWIIINVTNDNYAYVKAVQRPAGQAKMCRLTLAEDSSGTATAAADFNDADIVIVIPRQYAQQPLSGLGAMT